MFLVPQDKVTVFKDKNNLTDLLGDFVNDPRPNVWQRSRFKTSRHAKMTFVKELSGNSCRSIQGNHIKTSVIPEVLFKLQDGFFYIRSPQARGDSTVMTVSSARDTGFHREYVELVKLFKRLDLFHSFLCLLSHMT